MAGNWNGDRYNNWNSRNSDWNNKRDDYRGRSNPPKRSGAKFKEIEGAHIVSAWKKDRSGFWTLYARPYSKSRIIESKNGKEWINLFVTMTNNTTKQVVKTSGLLDLNRKRLYLKDFNMIVTKNGDGGYWGRHLGKRNNR